MPNMNFYTYDTIVLSDSSPLEVIKFIKNALVKYGESNVTFECDTETDYGDTYARVYLQCSREMTPEEKEIETKRRKTADEQQKAWKRKQYEQLKKEFE